jgi:hypothetical protein
LCLVQGGGGTRIGHETGIRNPFGGTPGLTTSMCFNYKRAGEKAWLVGHSQNFKRYDLPGVSLIVNCTVGRND